jgi:hypothetical protein
MAVNVEKRYRALRIISWVFRVLAVLVLIGIIISAILCFLSTEKAPPKAGSMLEEEAIKISPKGTAHISWVEPVVEFPLGMIIVAIALYAFGELISLLIALEENTRRTSLMLEQKGQT